MDNPTLEDRAELITRLQRLWQSDPGSYWSTLKRSGLTAQEVWPQQARAFVGTPLPRSETPTPGKRKNIGREES